MSIRIERIDVKTKDEIKAIFTDEVLEAIRDTCVLLDTDKSLCCRVDPYEAPRFVEACYEIAGKTVDWEE